MTKPTQKQCGLKYGSCRKYMTRKILNKIRIVINLQNADVLINEYDRKMAINH